MKRYESYKPSGIEWIGDVPEGWNIKRLRFVGTSKNGLTYSPSDICEENEGILVLRSSNIQDSKLSFEDNVFVKDVPKSLMVETGDLIICSRNGSLSLVGKCALVEDDIKATFGAFMLRLKSKINSKYTYYAVTCSISYYKGLMSTTTVNQLTVETLNNMSIPVPPLEEQTAIATYLDAKCAKIDNVVAVQQKRIELLKELKQSIITHAVTRGLDKNAKLKDSGVEWIGEVPEGWEVCKIKHNFKIYAGATPKTENKSYWDGDIVWITPADFKTEDKYIIQGERNITIEGYNSCNTQLVPKRSIIFSKRAPIGTVALNEVDLCTNQGCLSCVPKQVNSLFYYYVFSICTEMFDMLGSGATFKEISADIFANVKLPTPPLSEQTAIAAYLDKKCAIIDRQIAKVEKQIELLKEYKQSVITECVTGKRKVC